MMLKRRNEINKISLVHHIRWQKCTVSRFQRQSTFLFTYQLNVLLPKIVVQNHTCYGIIEKNIIETQMYNMIVSILLPI